MARLTLALAALLAFSLFQLPANGEAPPVQKGSVQEELDSPEMDALIAKIHADLLKISGKWKWLASYSEEALNPKSMIFYMPKEEPEKGPQPQQPPQLLITYVSMGVKKGFKYCNDIEDMEEPSFPKAGFRLYAHFVFKSSEDDALEKELRKLIALRCIGMRRKIEGAGNGSLNP